MADQVSKAAARAYLSPSRSIPIVPGIFELSYVRNTGGAFGIMSGQQWLFIATSFAVLAGIAFVWRHYHPREWYVVAALGLVVGGATGNLVDRLAFGRVTDFLYLRLWPVFNVADSGIVIGVAVLVVWLLFVKDDEHEHPAEDHADGTGKA